MPRINFFDEGAGYKLRNKTHLRQWITYTIVAEGFRLNEVSFIFCSDAYLLKINQDYLAHDFFTDIITFDNAEEEGEITGDIFISVERVRENALKFNQALTDELHRVMVHGVLHLLGYKDKTDSDQKKMTQMEDFYLSKRGFIN